MIYFFSFPLVQFVVWKNIPLSFLCSLHSFYSKFANLHFFSLIDEGYFEDWMRKIDAFFYFVLIEANALMVNSTPFLYTQLGFKVSCSGPWINIRILCVFLCYLWNLRVYWLALVTLSMFLSVWTNCRNSKILHVKEAYTILV